MSKDRKKEEKRPFLEYLAIKGDIGGDTLAGEVYLELRGRNCLLIKGCRRILGYSPERIVLSVKRGTLSVEGKRLVCTSFYSGSISVEGEIHSISFGTEGEI